MRDYYKSAVDGFEEVRKSRDNRDYRMTVISAYSVAIDLMRFMAEQDKPGRDAKNLKNVYIIASLILGGENKDFPHVSLNPFMYIQAMYDFIAEPINSYYGVPMEVAENSIILLWEIWAWVNSYRKHVGLEVEEVERL